MNWSDAIGFARRKWLSYFTAPLYPLAGVLIATLPLLLVWTLLHASILTVVAGLLWPLVVLADSSWRCCWWGCWPAGR